MKTKLFTLLVTLIATTTLWAYDFQYGDLYYNITSKTTVEVTYLEEYSSENYSGLTSVTIPETVTYEGKTYSVTSIGGYAFYGCSSLTSVTIGESVTSIHDYAFAYCSSLTSVTIGESVTSIGYGAFYYCTSLTSITIPNSVTSIGDEAFYNCSSLPIENNLRYADTYLVEAVDKTLSTYSIKNGTKWIGYNAFENCSSLTSITIPNSVTSIGNWAFSACISLTSITIPNSVTSIGNGAFYNCSSLPIENNLRYADTYLVEAVDKTLSTYSIKNGTKWIGYHAFENCSSLTSITIPNSVTSIGSYAFDGCSSLTSITIPNSVTSIGNYAFNGCTSLTSITIPNSVMSIGKSVFSSCTSLTSITIPNSVTSIGKYAFSDCVKLTKTNYTGNIAGWCNIKFGDGSANPMFYSHNFYINDQEIKDLVIPNTVDSIHNYAFKGCSSLNSITIPNSVTSIGGDAFGGCSSLTSITIPNSVTEIESYAFHECEKLGTVILGEKIKEIGNYAFEECNKLYHIYCYAPEPPIAEESIFTNYNVNLYVPCNYLDNYKYDRVFGSFRYIQCIDSEDVTTDDVVVTPGINDVTITWPTEGNADTYTIVIKKGNEVFCTLTFNSDGQLLNIAFAPGRDGNHPVQYAEQAGNGYRFTVTGLEEGTHYTYNIDVKDAVDKTIKSHSGEFTTQSTTAVDNVTTNNANIQKIIRDGQFIIIRDGVEYNAMGQEIGN